MHPEHFFQAYFDLVNLDHQEAPANTHRWSAISLIGTLLGNQFWVPFGTGRFLPNQYIQIIGAPASKKSTAIKLAKTVLKAYGYDSFAPEKTSLEKFLIDLHEATWGSDSDELDGDMDNILEENIFGKTGMKERAASMPPAECYIASDEFVDFIGRNNIDFISLLGSFWDYRGVFDRKLKHSKAVYINEPTINIIAGNTPTGFNAAFPPEMQGQGFFSRLLLIHTEASDREISRPAAMSDTALATVLEYMNRIKTTCVGEVIISEETWEFLDGIYKHYRRNPLKDPRFAAYNGRRYTHLLKLALVCAAMRISTEIKIEDIILANTILVFAEYEMPKAMGEFGRGRNSAVTQKVLEIIYTAKTPIRITDLLKHCGNDIDHTQSLQQVINLLITSEKIDVVEGIFLPRKQIIAMSDTEYVKPSLLLPEEVRLK
jgi:hypothetical protein